jgi:hypothetical protein
MGKQNTLTHIGTSGWHYKHWVGDFYAQRCPTDKMFSWYAREFHTLRSITASIACPKKKLSPTGKRWLLLASFSR